MTTLPRFLVMFGLGCIFVAVSMLVFARSQEIGIGLLAASIFILGWYEKENG